jgi:hypothetical protein
MENSCIDHVGKLLAGAVLDARVCQQPHEGQQAGLEGKQVGL